MDILDPGTRLHRGRYVVEAVLGVGATATVYRARDEVGGGHVALKRVCVATAAAGELVRRELLQLADLPRHPGIRRLFGVFADDAAADVLHLVLEHIKGEDLHRFVARDGSPGLPPARVHRLARELVDAIDHLHANGLVHRDVKPENVLIDGETGSVKLVDLGLSRRVLSVRTFGIGTADYVAPETLAMPDGGDSRATPGYGPPADVFSLGVTLFVALTGTLPFDQRDGRTDLTATLAKVASGRHRDFPPHLPEAAKALLAAMMEPDPDVRITLHAAREALDANAWL